VDEVVAAAADHEGLAAASVHGLRPVGLRLSGPVEIGERADVVDLNAVRSLAELASALLESFDQLLVRVDGSG
jgi:hypothetical protein